ncbi:MAG: hypothetical protein ACYC5H_10360 [Methylovirgula sp.]
MEVHYKWHPYFGFKVAVRRVEQRATGEFFSVLGPAGIVVSMASWMLDPAICSGMTVGAPRVDMAALVELKRLLLGAVKPANCRSDDAIIPEERNAGSQNTGSDAEPAVEIFVRQHQAGRAGARRARQDHIGAGSGKRHLNLG